MTSHIGIIPDCEAGTATPDPTAFALSLSGLHNMQKHMRDPKTMSNNNKANVGGDLLDENRFIRSD